MKIYRLLAYAAAFAIVSFGLVNFYLFSKGPVIIPDKPNKKRILLLAQVYQNPYWQRIKKGAEDAANNRGCMIEYDGPQTPSIKESLNIFEMGIAIGIDGIISYVQEEKNYEAIIKRATRSGIPVITIDSDASHSDRTAYVGTDNHMAGNAAGRQLAEITGYKSNIGIIMGGETTTSEQDRVSGLKEYISGNQGMKIIATESSNSDVIQAEIAAKKMLANHPEINALFCTSSVDGIGAARAVISLNKQGRTKIVCFEDLPETLRFIKEDVIQASVAQKAYQMGYDSVDKMMDNLEGKRITGEYLLGIIVVNKNNVSNYSMEKGEMN